MRKRQLKPDLRWRADAETIHFQDTSCSCIRTRKSIYKIYMTKTPKYDPKFIDKLMSEGMDFDEAVLAASAEMDGAYEKPDGGIHASQTHCGVLKYDEHLRGRTPGMREGQRNTKNALRNFLGGRTVDDWIHEQEHSRGRKGGGEHKG